MYQWQPWYVSNAVLGYDIFLHADIMSWQLELLCVYNFFLIFRMDQVQMRVNNMDLSFPHQCFIDNEFVDSSDGRTFDTINPNDESVCQSLSSPQYLRIVFCLFTLLNKV